MSSCLGTSAVTVHPVSVKLSSPLTSPHLLVAAPCAWSRSCYMHDIADGSAHVAHAQKGGAKDTQTKKKLPTKKVMCHQTACMNAPARRAAAATPTVHTRAMAWDQRSRCASQMRTPHKEVDLCNATWWAKHKVVMLQSLDGPPRD
jgi:hypothetical protein